jgi:hypothetical protein
MEVVTVSQEAIEALQSYSSELDLNWPELAVAQAIAWRADEHGILIVSHRRLAEQLGQSEATVKHVVRRLRRKGLVQAVANLIGGRPGIAPWYRLNLPGLSGNLANTVERVIEGDGSLPDAIRDRLGRSHDETRAPLTTRGGRLGDPVGGLDMPERGSASGPLSTSRYQLEESTREELGTTSTREVPLSAVFDSTPCQRKRQASRGRVLEHQRNRHPYPARCR